ncbi:MAG: hypothetical protein OXI96_09200 [Acidimicrobiaceae bacterium]|nr:hypothetical protein [Acidimicrobiaceae bacterium]
MAGTTWSCNQYGVTLPGRLSEFHQTGWQFDGYTPSASYSGSPPASPPPYPHGITEDSTSPYSTVETDVDRADDAYCIDWPAWRPKPWTSPIPLIPPDPGGTSG